jgi:hypothetical protein
MGLIRYFAVIISNLFCQLIIYVRNSNSNKKKNYDHNHLRITRIIKSTTLLLNRDIAESFFNKIMSKINRISGTVDDKSISYWKDALDTCR